MRASFAAAVLAIFTVLGGSALLESSALAQQAPCNPAVQVCQ